MLLQYILYRCIGSDAYLVSQRILNLIFSSISDVQHLQFRHDRSNGHRFHNEIKILSSILFHSIVLILSSSFSVYKKLDFFFFDVCLISMQFYYTYFYVRLTSAQLLVSYPAAVYFYYDTEHIKQTKISFQKKQTNRKQERREKNS